MSQEMYFMRMKELLQDEYDAYIDSLSKPLYRGLRVNLKKADIKEFDHLDKPSRFCKESYYVGKPLGNHPLHICGCFYLQERSASSAVEVLDVKEDDYVLDLCAAPGGKSTQIASHLKNGYLVSNEIDSKRAQILLSNMERMGVKNMAVTNTSVDQLAKVFHNCFDKILVDAPCSGEGMIKKHDVALNHWSIENIKLCAARQKEILEYAYSMLKPGGILVYSTCTYALEEDEEVVIDFLQKHEDVQLLDPHVTWGRKGFKNLNVRRIFPMDGGEGHFIAKLKKTAGSIKNISNLKPCKIDRIVETFLKEQLQTLPKYYYVDHNKVYGMDMPFVDFKKVKVLRQGVYLGDLIKNRFEPAHAFYMVSDFDYIRKADVSIEEMDAFMHGQVLMKEYEKGYVALCYNGHPFGFGKSDGKQIKNKIPKGLRLLPNSHVIL